MRVIPEYPAYHISDNGTLYKDFRPRKAYMHKSRSNIYLRASVYVNKVRIRKFIHELVALAYHGPKPPGYQVDHIDGNTLNNHWSNLEYVTHDENQKRRDKRAKVFQQTADKLSMNKGQTDEQDSKKINMV